MRLSRFSVIIIAVALMLSACGSGAATPTNQPTANSAATADTKAAATATTAPTATKAPTATPKPTATPEVSDAAQVIEQALKKLEADQSYAMDMTATLEGDLGEDAPPGYDPNKPFEFMGIVGTVDGKDSAFIMKGMIATILGADANKGIEFISIDNVTYVRGPIALLNAPENKWYIMPKGDSPADGFNSKKMLGSMAGDDLEKFQFTESGKESLHGQSCRLYDGDKQATINALKERKDENGLPTASDFGKIEDALMQFAVCEDGYVHRMIMSFTGQPEGQDKPVTMVMNMNLSDFGKVATIKAPADAEEIKSTK